MEIEAYFCVLILNPLVKLKNQCLVQKKSSFMFLRSNNHANVVKMEFATCFTSPSWSEEL
jgi:hypothetical protein